MRALRKVRQRYEGKSISTSELMDVFAEDLPPALRYEGKKSLDWFLDGWINGTSLPRLELKAVKFTAEGRGLDGEWNDCAERRAARSGDIGSRLRGGWEAAGASGTGVRRRGGIHLSSVGSGRDAQDRTRSE